MGTQLRRQAGALARPRDHADTPAVGNEGSRDPGAAGGILGQPAVPRRSCDIRGCRSSSVLGRCAGGEPPGVVLQPATLTAPASRAAPSARRDDGEDMLTIASLQKTFEVAGAQIPALRGVDLEISRGEFFVL